MWSYDLRFVIGLITGLFGSGGECLGGLKHRFGGSGFCCAEFIFVFELVDDVVTAEIVVGTFGRPQVGIGRGIAVRPIESIMQILICLFWVVISLFRVDYLSSGRFLFFWLTGFNEICMIVSSYQFNSDGELQVVFFFFSVCLTSFFLFQMMSSSFLLISFSFF